MDNFSHVAGSVAELLLEAMAMGQLSTACCPKPNGIFDLRDSGMDGDGLQNQDDPNKFGADNQLCQ